MHKSNKKNENEINAKETQNTKNIMQKKIRLAIVFTIGVLLSGWFGKLLDLLLVNQPKGQSIGSLIWLVTPAIMTVILVCFLPKGERQLGLKWNFKGNQNGNWKGYLISLFLFPLMAILLIGIACVLGLIDFTKIPYGKLITSFAIWFIVNFFRNILEEIAWRGFLTKQLNDVKLNRWLLYLCVTLVWGSWHIPYYLFFYNNENALQLILSGYINLACWSILFTELYLYTNSIWPCIVLHATSNAVQYVAVEPYLTMEKSANLFLSPATGIISGILCILLGLWFKKRNENKK